MPSSVVWTGPTSETIEAANHLQEGKKQGKFSLRQRGSVGGVAPAACPALPRYHSLAGCHQPTQRDAMVAGPVDHPVHPPVFLPAAPPLKVKGWGWVMRVGMQGKTGRSVESSWGPGVVLHV